MSTVASLSTIRPPALPLSYGFFASAAVRLIFSSFRHRLTASWIASNSCGTEIVFSARSRVSWWVPISTTGRSNDGAWIVEKHFTFDRSVSGPDHEASLEPEELSKAVSGRTATRKLEAGEPIAAAAVEGGIEGNTTGYTVGVLYIDSALENRSCEADRW